jgi:DNA polymerase III delta subunit
VKNIDKISKDVVRFISEYMKSNPGFKKNSILFLSCTDSKKISSMLPEISSFGELIKIDKAISEDMRKRLVEKNDLNNVRFTPHALTMFLENVADDPILFENEYEKILSNVYFDKTKIVSEEKVKALIHRSTESTVFDLVDCIGRKDFSKAVSIIPDILTGVSPNDSSVIIPIVTNLYRMFKTMLYIKSEKNGVQSAFGYLQKNINAKSYFLNIILKKYQIFEKKYSYDEIIRILGFLNEFDIEIKSKSNLPAKTYLGSLILNIQLIALQD